MQIIGWRTVWTLTLRQQQFDGAAVALGRSQHQRRATLLIADVDVCSLFQQQLCNLRSNEGVMENSDVNLCSASV